MSHMEGETDPILEDSTPLTDLRPLPPRTGDTLQFFVVDDFVADQRVDPSPEVIKLYNELVWEHVVAHPKRAPLWTATERGHLLYCGRVVADMRYSNARGRVPFILAALNAAEEKK
jgi:hypothetical protein